MSDSLRANFILGFLGAGQLARMSAIQAFRYGIRIAVYTDRPDVQQPVQSMTPLSQTGSFEDIEAMTKFAGTCDLVTLENEFIKSDILKEVEEKSGTRIFPSPRSFALIENKLIEKQTFEKAGIPVTPYALVQSEKELASFGETHGWPFLLKSSKGGYDGYGNKTVNDPEEAYKAYRSLGGEQGHDILAEAYVDFTHELAVQVARNQTGSVVYPCCETIQDHHICVAVKSPAPVDPNAQRKARELAVAATEAIDGKGIFAYEFFLTSRGELILNESAPRPHNSGHYTLEGCVTSQFENHIRAVLDLPLGSAELRKPAVAMINLLGSSYRLAQAQKADLALEVPDGHLHLYGKLKSKPGRKMGHYTLLGEDLENVYLKAKQLTDDLNI
ncbi:MAG: 5-(carboxyamino)imidazole ribonucleotide synthase [Balneolaceae bacterium]